jgi:hypothetical protein
VGELIEQKHQSEAPGRLLAPSVELTGERLPGEPEEPIPHQPVEDSILGKPLARPGFDKPERENLAGLVRQAWRHNCAWTLATLSSSVCLTEHPLAGGDVGDQVHAYADRHHAQIHDHLHGQPRSIAAIAGAAARVLPRALRDRSAGAIRSFEETFAPLGLPALAWHIRGITALAIAFVVVGGLIRLGGLG